MFGNKILTFYMETVTMVTGFYVLHIFLVFRRKILTSTSIPAPRSGRVRFTADDTKNGELGDSEDYIHRLENLQTRLGTLQNGMFLL